ncbi:hypothetical protein [Clostridium butyricum]|jgi:hypothetical protein|uniref:hypothetical protein n=1 Tax=Clostridium butyricum TaxID=1492 RepID=UPI0011DDF438|nr:hypothetical protein [Clostridium butyricum]
MDKESLLKEIFDYYQYKYQICIDGTVKEFNEDGMYTLLNSIDEALKNLVHTMEETNNNLFETGDIESKDNTWSNEQIDFIKSLT